MNDKELFNREMIKKVARKRSASTEPIQDDLYENTDLSKKDKPSGAMVAAARKFAGGGGIANVATSAAFASKNPTAIGAALGLQAVSSILGNKQREKQAEYQNKVNALNNLMSFTKGMGAL